MFISYNSEALALLANKCVCWHTVVVEEDFIRIDCSSAHFLDLPQLQTWGIPIEVDEEQREAIGLLLDIL